MRYLTLGWFSILLVAATANAEWLEASSDHFVIYGEQNEKTVRAFAERLERFHAAMALALGTAQAKPSPSNRVTIFVLPSASKVRRVTGERYRFLVGQYIPRAGSSVALIPKLRKASMYGTSGETILYHEYAHHFMITGLTVRAYPRWFVEGFAEFFSGAKFEADGSVILGAPLNSRLAELRYAREVPIRTLLAFDGGSHRPKPVYDSFYGQSWLLFHVLQMAPERKGQLAEYQRLLATGRPALDAAEGAFGDLDQLDRDMEAYLRRRTVSATMIAGSALTIGPIALRELRPGEAAMMPITIESKVGVTREEALTLLPKAREVAARHPTDPAVLAALAEAEFDAGNDDDAIAAAERALAIDPKQINAHIQKGYALAHKAMSGALPQESWKDVRTQFAIANRVENDHPVPLVGFYLSYIEQGEPPTKNAIEGLEWAMALAPFDASLRWLVAKQMVSDKRFEEAAHTLGPLAYSPHPGEHTDKALALLKEIEAQLELEEQEVTSTKSRNGNL